MKKTVALVAITEQSTLEQLETLRIALGKKEFEEVLVYLLGAAEAAEEIDDDEVIDDNQAAADDPPPDFGPHAGAVVREELGLEPDAADPSHEP